MILTARRMKVDMREACGIIKNRQDRGAGRGYVKCVRCLSSEMIGNFTRKSLAFALGIIIFAILTLLPSLGIQSTNAQSDSPRFRNPPEVSRRPDERD